MNGIELSKGYYEEYGKPMLEKDFADVLPYLAVGIVGSGSDRFGFDDEISRDHDFEPGFCIFLPGEEIVDRRKAFQLERAYSKLPKEYGGEKRQPMSPVGGNRNGVIRTADFYAASVGSPNGDLSVEMWISIPDSALAEAVNGEIWLDNYGEFSKIRNRINNMPEDILLKRIAGNILIMAQAGQYNFLRCMDHGEFEASQLACHDYVNAAMKAFFLLNHRYLPYYKWSFRALRQLEGGEKLADKLSFLLFCDHRDGDVAAEKYDIIESVAADFIDLLHKNKMTEAICGDLEKHAYSINDHITDSQIRNMNILAAV